jgi:uncharacterized protein (UPF0548 family)
MTTRWVVTPMDEMGETLGVVHRGRLTFWHHESDRSLALGVHGTPNCCYEHAEQNLERWAP